MPEETPSTPASSEEEQDYSQLTLEELDKRFEAGEGMIPDEEPAAPPEPAAEPEPEPVPEVAAEPAEPEVPVEEPPVEPSEPEYDEQAAILEETRLELEKVERERQKFEFLTGRESGEKGFLKKRVEALEEVIRQATQQQQPQTDDYAAETTQPQVVQPLQDTGIQSRVAELETGQREEATRQEYQQFLNDNQLVGRPQEELAQVMSELAPDFQRHFEPYKDMDLNPKSFRKVFRMALDSSFTDLKLARVKKHREEALAKKAAQVDARKIAKQAAVVSGSGASPAPKPQPKAQSELSADEADAALVAEFGDGQRRRRRR